jgi:hypothetical protein
MIAPYRQIAVSGNSTPTPKKEQGGEPCSKNCVDPVVPADSDFVLIGGVTLLVRVRVPPETWTTRDSLATTLQCDS